MPSDSKPASSLLAWLVQDETAGSPHAGRTEHLRPRRTEPHSALDRRLRDMGEIARGSKTSVRRVLDIRLSRIIAMKVLDPRCAKTPRDVARFQEEARITGLVSHPHVPAIHDLGTDAGGT